MEKDAMLVPLRGFWSGAWERQRSEGWAACPQVAAVPPLQSSRLHLGPVYPLELRCKCTHQPYFFLAEKSSSPKHPPRLPKRQSCILLFISPLFISPFVPSLRSYYKAVGFLTPNCFLAFQLDLGALSVLSVSHNTSKLPTFKNAN